MRTYTFFFVVLCKGRRFGSSGKIAVSTFFLVLVFSVFRQTSWLASPSLLECRTAMCQRFLYLSRVAVPQWEAVEEMRDRSVRYILEVEGYGVQMPTLGVDVRIPKYIGCKTVIWDHHVFQGKQV